MEETAVNIEALINTPNFDPEQLGTKFCVVLQKLIEGRKLLAEGIMRPLRKFQL